MDHDQDDVLVGRWWDVGERKHGETRRADQEIGSGWSLGISRKVDPIHRFADVCLDSEWHVLENWGAFYSVA